MSKFNLYIVLIVIINFTSAVFCIIQSINYYPVVETKHGKLRGTVMTLRSGKIIRAFLGIRYAEPPIGPLRFMPPVRIKAWQGVKNVFKIHPVCPQKDIFKLRSKIEGKEDCLFLNVYANFETKSNLSLPVMVYIHGGKFVTGSGNTNFFPPDTLMQKKIVLVTINYRLGSLGFLSKGDEFLPGNYGLKDQNLALRWVKTHISAFNGDPDCITIFGGASVTFHMMSQSSNGLFHRAISLSGTAHCPWAFASRSEHVEYANELAKLFACPTNITREMVNCLRNQEVRKLVNADRFFKKFLVDPLVIFKPVYEDLKTNKNGFITRQITPNDSVFESDVPWIIGTTTHEGSFRVPLFFEQEGTVKKFDQDFMSITPIALFYDRQEDLKKQKVSALIKKFYFQDQPLTIHKKQQLIEMFGDRLFLYGNVKSAQLFLKTAHSKIYFYLFGYKGTTSLSRLYGDSNSTGAYGVAHGDDLQYITPLYKFYWPSHKYSEKDKEISNLLISMWVNFAKTGNPTPEKRAPIKTIWKPAYTEEIEYLFINQNETSMKVALYPERVKFWQRIERILHGG